MLHSWECMTIFYIGFDSMDVVGFYNGNCMATIKYDSEYIYFNNVVNFMFMWLYVFF